MVKSIGFSGGFFEKNTKIELFPKNNTLQVIYGKNGSGKSTITNAVLKAKGSEVPEIESAELFDENGNIVSNTDNIYVFNERYINEKVKIKEDGLETILLMGDLVGIEEEIEKVKARIKDVKKEEEKQGAICDQYKDINKPTSPEYFLNQINIKLTEDGGWADREKHINDAKRKSSVTEPIRREIEKISVDKSEKELKDNFYRELEVLDKARDNKEVEVNNTRAININFDLDTVRMLLAKKIEKPVLTDREKYLLSLVEQGKMSQIESMKKEFGKSEVNICPFCLQEVNDKHKHDLINSINNVLSKEVDKHKRELDGNRIEKIQMDFSSLDIIGSKHLKTCEQILNNINGEIERVNEKITCKCVNPYEPIIGFKSSLLDLIKEYEDKRKLIEEDINRYNEAVKDTKKVKRKLKELNKQIAHLETEKYFDSYNKILTLKRESEHKLSLIKAQIASTESELTKLNARKRNVYVAEKQINSSLRYVFFCKDRLEIRVKGNRYTLYSYGKPVRPDNVSVGERNIIALCYFFTELMNNKDIKNQYSQKMLVVIDDPVSSFDFENKIGIMSLLKEKLDKIVTGNNDSQIIVLTHDMQCMFGFYKIYEEIAKDSSKNISYSGMELKDKRIETFSYKHRHEYTELIKLIYGYAMGNTEEYKYLIGNVMRRVLEAFSTFLYKKSIKEVSCDKNILDELRDEDYIEYFQNLMYRLVLHGESHMEERVKALEDTEYLEFISEEAKQRTAKEVLSFMYLLNKRHVLAHLNGERDVSNNIDMWCKKIKDFSKNN